MTVRVTMAPLSVMTCTLVDGATAEDTTLVLRVDDCLLLEDDCVCVLVHVGYGIVEQAKKRD